MEAEYALLGGTCFAPARPGLSHSLGSYNSQYLSWVGHILSLVTSGIKRWARLDWAQEKLLLRQVALAPGVGAGAEPLY